MKMEYKREKHTPFSPSKSSTFLAVGCLGQSFDLKRKKYKRTDETPSFP